MATPSKSASQSHFEAFYTLYAPKLWGIILRAKLPISQSEQILFNTLTKAWQQISQGTSPEGYMLSWLIGLTYQEGLPRDFLQPSWQPHK